VRRIAITGGVAEGKSTVLGYLRDLGYSVESSDRISRKVFESQEIQTSIAELLNISPPINPETLRERLSDSGIRRAINALMHPPIIAAITAMPFDFIEVPLLIEACLQSHFDRVWVVTCGPEEQLRRLTARLDSEPAATALIGTQLTSRAKIAFADSIIRTNREESSVKRCVSLAAQRDLR
jgi:dephospho-CoA kinase